MLFRSANQPSRSILSIVLSILPLLSLTLASASVSSPDQNLESRAGGLGGTIGGVVGGTVSALADIQAGASFCISLGSSFQFDASVAKGQSGAGAGLTLNEGVCICADVNVLDLDVEVVTSAGVNFTGALAARIENSIIKDVFGLNLGLGAAAALKFDIDDFCLQLAIGIPHSHHDFHPGSGGCCARACDAGYTKNSAGQCAQTTCPTANQCLGKCYDTPQITCNNKCYAANAYTCPSGVPVVKTQVRRRDRDSQWCGLGLTRCAVPGQGARSAGWECVDVGSDIESCGGCMFPSSLTHASYDSHQPTGQDCTAIPNVNEVACHHGSCEIRSCQRGFQLANNGTTCEVKGNSRVANSNSNSHSYLHSSPLQQAQSVHGHKASGKGVGLVIA